MDGHQVLTGAERCGGGDWELGMEMPMTLVKGGVEGGYAAGIGEECFRWCRRIWVFAEEW